MTEKPGYLRPLFWDVDFAAFDPLQHTAYTIERIMEYGDAEAVQWVVDHFPKSQLVQTLRTSRQLSRRSANFWRLMLQLSKEQVACLTTSFQKTHRSVWPY